MSPQWSARVVSGCRVLPGRDRESELLARLLEAVLGGKAGHWSCTANLAWARPPCSNTPSPTPRRRVARAAGVQSEMELAFSGLHQLCGSLLGHVNRLPTHQRDALTTALGLHDGPAPNRFLVGLAVLRSARRSRARTTAHLPRRRRPMARPRLRPSPRLHRSASRRRIRRHALRHPPHLRHPRTSTGLPSSLLAGLPRPRCPRAARLRAALARRRSRPRPHHRRSSRQPSRAAPTPPRPHPGRTSTGGFGPAPATALPPRIETCFRRQLAPLPSRTRQLLLLAAAEPLGDPTLLWKAALTSASIAEAAAPAAAAELLTIDSRVRFHHPLQRSATYTAASPHERRRAHHALAYATDPHTDPDRHAWHAAQATTHPRHRHR